jgi:hypothetical protein
MGRGLTHFHGENHRHPWARSMSESLLTRENGSVPFACP